VGLILVVAVDGIGWSPYDESVGLLGPDRHSRVFLVPGLLTGFASSATGIMARHADQYPGALARSLAPLTDLDPVADLASTLDLVVVAAKQLFGVDAVGLMFPDADGRLRRASASDPLAQALEDNQETHAAGPCLDAFVSGQPAIMHDATLKSRWGEGTLAFVALRIRSALSVPIQSRRWPDRHPGCVRRRPRGWDATEVSSLQTYAGLAATLLGYGRQGRM
jgi:hypothetical protein